MNTTDLITQIKTLHDTVQTVGNQTTSAGQNGVYAQGARTALQTAINQLMLHQYWVEPEIAEIKAAALPVTGTAAVPVAPAVVSTAVPASSSTK